MALKTTRIPGSKSCNNRCFFRTVELLEEAPGLKVEPDHELVWLTPEQTIVNLKNEGYAWAVTLWLRAIGADRDRGIGGT